MYLNLRQGELPQTFDSFLTRYIGALGLFFM